MSLAAVWFFAAVQSVGSQQPAYPSRVITIVTPYAGGGLGLDFGHLIAERLEKEFRSAVIVEARPGGNGTVAAVSVVRSIPDGHTLLINSTSVVGTAATIYKTPRYEPATDLVPVALVASWPMVLVVNAELPIHSLQDLVALARSRQGGLSFGSLGVGSAAHLSGEYLKRSLNIDLTHVPYRGVAPSLNDVAAGHIAFMFNDILNALPLIQAGKLRPIGVTAARRAGALPDVPALSEIGLPTFDIGIRLALFAPAKTPAAVIADLNGKIRGMANEPGLRPRYHEQGIQVIESAAPYELIHSFRHEIVGWSKLVQDAGLAHSQ